jgi:hypothetical protein
MSLKLVIPQRRLTLVLMALAFTLALAALLVAVALAGGPSSAQAAAPVVGVPAAGRTGFEFVSRVDQVGGHFTSYGYLTYIYGLNDSALFTDPINRNESTARFTFYSSITLTARSVISSVFVLDSIGTTTFYFDENPYGGTSFGNPSSFQTGAPIATFSGRYQDILNVQGPNVGIANGMGELTQLTAQPFVLLGQTYRLGQGGLAENLWFTGEGTRTDPISPNSITVGAGHATVTGLQTTFPLADHNSR